MRPVALLLAAAVLLQGCSRDGSRATNQPTSPSSPAALSVAGLRLCCGSDQVDLNTQRQVIAIAYMSDGSEQEVTALVKDWASSNPAVATISTRGVVSGLTPGPFRITATHGGREGIFDMRVLPPSVYRPPAANDITGKVEELTVLGPLGVTDAEVEVVGGPGNGRVTRTIGDGFFRFDGLERADFDVVVRRRGYAAGRVHVGELGREFSVNLVAAPDVISDVFEGEVCLPSRGVSRTFTPRSAGFFRITAANQNTTRTLFEDGIRIRDFLPNNVDVELRAGVRYEFQIYGSCDHATTSGLRMTVLRPKD